MVGFTVARKNSRRSVVRDWTQADSAIWHTIDIVDQLMNRQVPDRDVSTFFPLREDEVPLAAGHFLIDSMRAAGDGSYVHNTSFAFGTGLLGVALTAGTLIGSAAANANRRAQAMADAQVTWRPDFSGLLVVTNRGFYLQTATGIHRWNWEAITMTESQGFSCLVLQGESVDGIVTWRLHSDWAELVFALWALFVHPRHPQFVNRSWIPEHWEAWASSMGYPVRSAGSALAQDRELGV